VPSPSGLLEVFSEYTLLTFDELWLRCFALGSMRTAEEMRGFLVGSLDPTRHDYNLIAVALNEHMRDIGVVHVASYVEDESER
jgi:hypothetical protein